MILADTCVFNHRLVNLSCLLNLGGWVVMNMIIFTGSGRLNVILYVQCGCMKFLLSPMSTTAELITGGLQVRVLAVVWSCVSFLSSFFTQLIGLLFIVDRGVPANYHVPYKCEVLIIQRRSPHQACRVHIVDSRIIIMLHPVLSLLLGGLVLVQNPHLQLCITLCPECCQS
jgi:hypothetical protein